MKILAIETSCDETACAVVKDGIHIISSALATSAEMHQKYGGIVPEVAARRQLESILPVITEALSPLKPGSSLKAPQGLTPLLSIIKEKIDAIAVTVGPGLIGSLLIGVETAKTIAFVTGKPVIPVNHVLAHMFANFVDNKNIQFPAISLVVSGGHTELYLMKSVKELKWLGGTLDDAAGEAFDKTARLLGFGSGGGVAIQEAAKKFKVKSLKLKVVLPRPMMHDQSLNFSFSGLKTAVMREFQKVVPCDSTRNDLEKIAFAYEVQEAITDVLVTKTLRAARQYEAKSILLSGGVAANTRLREKFSILHSQFSIHVPPIELCTDNAAYIGSYAYFYGKPIDWHEITAVPDLSVEL